MLAKIPVFLKALGQQSDASGEVRAWMNKARGEFAFRQKYRGLLWENNPKEAFEEWLSDFRQLYVGLVTNMQILTGAMSGPATLLDRLGMLSKLSGALRHKSTSTDYLKAFNYLKTGMITRDEFLERFGHRGFYESDIGQKRFYEYTEAEWRQLLPEMVISEPPFEYRRRKKKTGFWEQLFSGVIRLIHTREWLRDEAMKLFWQFRREMLERTDFPFWKHRPEVLAAYFAGEYAARSLKKSSSPSPAGWDMDTFLCNRYQRRLPLQVLANVGGEKEKQHTGIGIYPGKVEGRVWRLSSANLEGLEPPPFEKTILVADALDPGWVPYFSQVDGVISYVGGLLSHASIILRESRIPAITQLPAHISLETGDWIEMNGQTGEVIVLSEREESEVG